MSYAQHQAEIAPRGAVQDDERWAADWHDFLTAGKRDTYESNVRLRVLDLFSGVGGLALGVERAAEEHGMAVDSAGAVDLDGRALGVYSANHRTQHTHESSVEAMVDFQVRGEGSEARFLYEPEMLGPAANQFVGRVDVVLAGPPCQGHSSLNNVTRGNDPRNRLYLTVPAVARAVGASCVVIENVPGVARSRGNVVDTAIQLLESSGFSVASGMFAADTLGWPQTRKRYFVVGRRGSDPVPLAQISHRYRREPLSVAWAIGDLLDHVADPHDPLDAIADMTPENLDRIAWMFENDAYDTPNHLRPDCHKEGTSYGAVYGRMWWDKPAPTLTTGFLTAGRGRFVHPKRPRTLTPREAARIQGFPDWFDFRVDPSEVRTRSELAKWIGNAVPSILGWAAGLSAFGWRQAEDIPERGRQATRELGPTLF